MQSGVSNSRHKLYISLGVLAFILAIYAQVVKYDFVHYDDGGYVFGNPIVRSGITWPGVWWALTTHAEANWHPLTWLSHMLDVQLFGLNAGGHHATNVLLHIGNSVLLLWLLDRLTGNLSRSAFVAAIFAVHPLHVESVAWIAERKDVLSTFLGLLTLWTYAAYVRQPRWTRYVPMLILYALSLMAKPMLVTLPFVLLLLDFWPLRRNRPIGRLIVEKLPLIGLATASSFMTLVAQAEGNSVSPFSILPLDVRLKNTVVSYAEYIWKIVWPMRLAIFYPYMPQRLDWWVATLPILIVFSVASIAVVRRFPYVFVGWFWFIGMLVPVIGIIQVGRQPMADRYTYLPMVGIWMIVAWGAPDILRSVKYRQVVLATAAVVIIVVNGVTAWTQVHYWKDSIALWTHALDVTSDNYLAHFRLAGELAGQGKHEDAIFHLAESIRISPNNPESQYFLGVEFATLQKWDDATAHLRRAIELVPDYMEARGDLAYALLREGKSEDARRELSKILSVDPNNSNALAMMRQLEAEPPLH